MPKESVFFLSPTIFKLQSKKRNSKANEARFKNTKEYKNYIEDLLLKIKIHLSENKILVIFTNHLGKSPINEIVVNESSYTLKAEYSYAFKTKELKSEWEANLSNWALIFSKTKKDLNFGKGWAFLDFDYQGQIWPSESLSPLIKGLSDKETELISLGYLSLKLQICCKTLERQLQILPFI